MKEWTPFLFGASAVIILLYLGKQLSTPKPQGEQP